MANFEAIFTVPSVHVISAVGGPMALYKDNPDGSEEPMNRITPRRRPTLVYTFDCITGDKDHPTDKGNFSIFAKDEKHVSHKYSVKMHYAMFFTHDGKAIHQYHGPAPFWLVRGLKQDASDWFGSHGCVRLTEEDASTLYKWAPMHTRIIIK